MPNSSWLLSVACAKIGIGYDRVLAEDVSVHIPCTNQWFLQAQSSAGQTASAPAALSKPSYLAVSSLLFQPLAPFQVPPCVLGWGWGNVCLHTCSARSNLAFVKHQVAHLTGHGCAHA